ncbi:ribosome maturation factor RimP [Clostridium saccharobutylicum]|uniref:Ribosome maturation factor RimP n=1 Tax=Clostridium saccharobutylicum DSM 13864 TaxID=1345695 RepID=U5MSP6_CLOSA|nr:ribosome maturation factor RimP [Clostridium saccharobutylicum]AGX42437.1 ribosome maturation factor RimP [Clostridium saccharobutylicum DSM 13864]AQR89721.1 ribosome maturation factor RimP [Clostridium saccharobutylicum]AQR99623.1 ribosome maturation factor RimP [Clostridium saccharobutylicum]AQS13609.1 ribosome maturation factor RimP [Clostridium saccharobutylicum]MBA2906487.1 ribosome maturation factor RimP [Clostridium saccharobutylicum]
MKKDVLIQKIEELVRPITSELSYELYYVEYIKENGDFYLRIYIDKEEGRISLNDCEAVSRRVSDILDKEDPIEGAYYLEVSSPGLNRGLYTEEHFKKFIGKEVLIRFTSSFNGMKSIKGILKASEEEFVIVEDENEVKIPRDKIKSANLEGEI